MANATRKPYLIKLFAVGIVTSTFCLIGCSKEEKATATATATASQANAVPSTVASAPLEQYQKIIERNIKHGNDESEFVLVYYALCNCAVNYDEIAATVSYEYTVIRDVFEKKATLDKLKPEIDSKLAAIKKTRMIAFEQYTQVGAYDFNSKSFPIQSELSDPLSFKYTRGQASAMSIGVNGTSLGNLELAVRFTNGNLVTSIQVPDETQAKEIERLRHEIWFSNYVRIIVYGYVESVGIEKIKRMQQELNLSGRSPAFETKEVKEDIRVINVRIIRYSLNVHSGGSNDLVFGRILAGAGYSVQQVPAAPIQAAAPAPQAASAPVPLPAPAHTPADVPPAPTPANAPIPDDLIKLIPKF